MTESQSLDPNEFRVPASDTKGHNLRFQMRYQPGMAQQLENIVGSHRWPYKTQADVVRHAVLRHLHWLEQQFPVKSVTAQVEAISAVMREEEFQQEFENVFNKLQAQVNTMIGGGRKSQATALVTRVWLMLQDMPDGDWKKDYVGEMQGRFGSMVKPEEVNLNTFVEEKS